MTARDAGTVVVVGAGHAGGRAAEALRAAGHAGRLVLVGAERHPPYERPPLSKQVLVDAAPKMPLLRAAETWGDLGVELRCGVKVTALDIERSCVELCDGDSVDFDQVLITTGTRPRRLPDLEKGPVEIRYLRDLDDALALRAALAPGRAVAIVGGGVIGLEVAAAAITRGCAVTVIELADTLLARSVPPVVSACLEREHRRRGVGFRYGVSAVGSRPGVLVLSDGTEVPADIAVIGIGVTAELCFAPALCDDSAAGVPVDDFGRTRAERVFAAGDVAFQSSRWCRRGARIETWANAQNQAIRVAANMVGEPRAYEDPPWFWSDQYDLNLQVVGDPRSDDIVVRGTPDSARFTVIGLCDGEVAGAATMNAQRDMAVLRRLTAAGARVDRSDLEDPAFDLRRALVRK